MKRSFFRLAILACCLCLILGFRLATPAEAAKIVASGACGADATWELDDEGTMIITGTGKIELSYYTNWPHYGIWEERVRVKTVIIQDGITEIGDRAFYHDAPVSTVSIPASVTSIGSEAFTGCYISKLYIEDLETWVRMCAEPRKRPVLFDSLANNGYTLYLNGQQVTDLVIPEGITTIGAETFHACRGVTSVTIPEGVTSIGTHAFAAREIANVSLPSTLKTIGDGAFFHTSLTKIDIPSGVTTIDGYAFKGTKLTQVDLPSSVTMLGDGVFSETAITSITIPARLGKINDYTFDRCTKLTKVIIEDGITEIGESAFSECSSLRYIVIPSSVTKIDIVAFSDCPKLGHIYFCGNKPTVNEYAFEWDEVYGLYPEGNDTYTDAACPDGLVKWVPVSEEAFANPTGHEGSTEKTVTKATLTKDGKITYKNPCTICDRKSEIIPKVGLIKLTCDKSLTYNGKTRKPGVAVSAADGTELVEGRDYTLTYSSGRKLVGKYKITVKGKGNYNFTKTLTFKIIPKGTSLTDLAAKSNSIKAKWSKRTSQTTGYQLQYCTNDKFTSAKTVTISGTSKVSTTIKGLKSGTNYFFRIRTYKKVNGTKYYSKWSSPTVYVTTKK